MFNDAVCKAGTDDRPRLAIHYRAWAGYAAMHELVLPDVRAPRALRAGLRENPRSHYARPGVGQPARNCLRLVDLVLCPAGVTSRIVRTKISQPRGPGRRHGQTGNGRAGLARAGLWLQRTRRRDLGTAAGQPGTAPL